jgi:thioredoxin reductase (NADPH)
MRTQIAIIGAGPAALFLIFELGLLEIPCHVVDVLPFVNVAVGPRGGAS